MPYISYNFYALGITLKQIKKLKDNTNYDKNKKGKYILPFRKKEH
jgi:hypothetical protein